MITTSKEKIDEGVTVECEYSPEWFPEYRLSVTIPAYGRNVMDYVRRGESQRLILDLTPALMEAIARHAAHIQYMARAEAALELKAARDEHESSADQLARPLLDRVTAETCRTSLLTPKAEWVSSGVVSPEGMVVS